MLLVSPPWALQAQGGFYGPALRADSLANTPIGKAGIQVSCRFRATPGGVFQGARPFLIWSFKRQGYHAGTGGTLKVELQTDDGTAPAPPLRPGAGHATSGASPSSPTSDTVLSPAARSTAAPPSRPEPSTTWCSAIPIRTPKATSSR